MKMKGLVSAFVVIFRVQPLYGPHRTGITAFIAFSATVSHRPVNFQRGICEYADKTNRIYG